MSALKSLSPRSQDAASAVLPVVERLLAAIEKENCDIAGSVAVDYRAFTERKTFGLYELTKMRTLIAQSRGHPAVSSALAQLSSSLDINRRLLAAQLKAAQTIAGIVARAIRDSQSDGTYSAYPWRDHDG